MPTPAATLLGGSSLQSGTPWEHLNAQIGGSSAETEFVLVEAVKSVDSISAASVSCSPDIFEAEIVTVSTVSILEQAYTAECSDVNEVTI